MKNQKGITLIALVITIIVLLILAGISIAMLTGDNGILTKANEAGTSTEKAGVADKVNMAIQAAYTDYIIDNPGTTTPMPVSNIVTQYVAENGSGSASGASSPLTITEDDGDTFTVTLVTSGSGLSYYTTVDNIEKND